MKKWLGSFIALALFLVPINAIAAVKAGDSCKKVGVTATANGKKFTCVKSGKKLVWNKGVAVVKPTPTVTLLRHRPQPLLHRLQLLHLRQHLPRLQHLLQ
jgi:hypothetical protein